MVLKLFSQKMFRNPQSLIEYITRERKRWLSEKTSKNMSRIIFLPFVFCKMDLTLENMRRWVGWHHFDRWKNVRRTILSGREKRESYILQIFETFRFLWVNEMREYSTPNMKVDLTNFWKLEMYKKWFHKSKVKKLKYVLCYFKFRQMPYF